MRNLLSVGLLTIVCAPLCVLAQSEPISPQANSSTKAILQYLYELPQREDGRCLTGQDVGVRGDPEIARAAYQRSVVDLETETGDRPAILEYAMFHDTGRWLTPSEQKEMHEEIIARNKEGHLIYLNMRPAHPAGILLMIEEGIPIWQNVKANTQAPNFHVDLDSVLDPEGKNHGGYQEVLTYASNFIKPLEEAGVPLLFEVFNEFNGDWNWFGKADPEAFRALWRYTVDYFVKREKFTNLLFVIEYSANSLQREKIPAQAYYPGDEYVDIVGFDFYHSDPQDTYVDVYKEMLSFGKPVAMAEYGPQLRDHRKENGLRVGEAVNVWDNRIQTEFTKKYYPECCFFIRWGFDWAMISQNHAKEFMNDPWWANLNELKEDRVASGW